jgi:hypothetical protein
MAAIGGDSLVKIGHSTLGYPTTAEERQDILLRTAKQWDRVDQQVDQVGREVARLVWHGQLAL